ncbi:MAG: ABC transporter substrate-binding protein [Polyangiales bacterium]
MISRRRFISGLAVGSAAAALPGALSVGCKKKGGGEASEREGASELVIGSILGLSGEDASLGKETREGMDIALQEINDAGGFKGKKIKLLYEDTKLDANLANEKIQKLIDRDRVICVIGDAASGPTLGARGYAEKAKVPLISGSATAVGVTKGAKYVFRVCFTDDTQGQACAKFARDTLKADTAAIIYATGNKYSEGLQVIFQQEFEKRGGKVVAKETYQMGETNILTFMNKIKEANPAILFAPVYPSDLTKIGPTKQQIGLQAKLLGTDGWDGPATQSKGVIETLEGSYFTDLFAADGPLGKSEFIGKYAKLYGKPPSSLSAGGYDALKLVIDALGRASALTSEALRTALEQTKGFQGVTGTITMDEGHNAQKPVPVMKIVNGEFKYDSQIEV